MPQATKLNTHIKNPVTYHNNVCLLSQLFELLSVMIMSLILLTNLVWKNRLSHFFVSFSTSYSRNCGFVFYGFLNHFLPILVFMNSFIFVFQEIKTLSTIYYVISCWHLMSRQFFYFLNKNVKFYKKLQQKLQPSNWQKDLYLYDLRQLQKIGLLIYKMCNSYYILVLNIILLTWILSIKSNGK